MPFSFISSAIINSKANNDDYFVSDFSIYENDTRRIIIYDTAIS